MLSLEYTLVYGIIVIKPHEGESTLFLGLLVGDDINTFNIAELAEVLTQMILFVVLLDSANKDFLDGHASIGVSGFFTGNSAFGFDLTPVYDMGSCCLGIVKLSCCFVGDEPKTTRLPGVWITHDHTVNDIAPFIEILL